MKLSRRKLISAVILCCALAVIIVISRARPSKNVQKIEILLDKLCFGSTSIQRESARKELGLRGPDLSPYIVSRFANGKSFWIKSYRMCWLNSPNWFQKLLPVPSKTFGAREAREAFAAIGVSAAPFLVDLLQDDRPAIRQIAAESMREICMDWCENGNDKEGLFKDQVVQKLRVYMKSANPWLSGTSAELTGFFGKDASDSTGTLVTLLGSTGSFDRSGVRCSVAATATQTLGLIGPRAESAVPFLQKQMKEKDPEIAAQAAIAIWRINADGTNTLPIMIGYFGKVREKTTLDICYSLQKMGSNAQSAYPTLLRQLRPDGKKRHYSNETLDEITTTIRQLDRLRSGETHGQRNQDAMR